MLTKLGVSIFLTVLCMTDVCAHAQTSKALPPIHCDYVKDDPLHFAGSNCIVNRFDRPENEINGKRLNPTPGDNPLLTLIWAINSPASKDFYTGTVLTVDVDSYESCVAHDWKVTALSVETSNVVIYGPADVNQMCTQPPPSKSPTKLMIVLPVKIIWAEVFSYPGNIDDPTRKVPSPVGAPSYYCGTMVPPVDAPDLPVPPKPSVGIVPCDKAAHPHVYNNPFIKFYNSATQPGASQGTISITPGVGQPPLTGNRLGVKGPSDVYTFDVQLYASWKLGYGYIGLPFVIEKATANGADLASFTPAISYDIPFAGFEWARPKPADRVPTATDCGFITAHDPRTDMNKHCPVRISIRPVDLRLQYGPELSLGPPHDINMVAASTLRLPILVDFHHQPSAFSLFPLIGVEGGNHVLTHLDKADDIEPSAIFRQVVGFDASMRFPYYLTHSFLGDKPMTVDFSWRTRFLSYDEPFLNYVHGISETLTSRDRSYWRGSFIFPLATFASFKLTVQHGALPPDFKYLGYTVNLGVMFANPGYSEH